MAIDVAKTRGLCDWKCIFHQWITGSIFLKCGYPEKHNEINSLEAAIPATGRCLTPFVMRQADESSERSGLP